jgi:cytochrome c oxidase assembly protein subunit 15
MLAGGFVAGLKAGLTYNTFPLMDGHLVPDGYGEQHPFLRNLTENIAAVQFDHRLLASLTAMTVLVTVLAGLRFAPPAGRRALLVLGAMVVAQYTLGIATLLMVVPVALATAHQVVAVLLLTAALVALHTLRATGTPEGRLA